VAIVNSHRAFPKGSVLPRFVSIHLRLGELIQPPKTKKREDLLSTTKEIQISINSMLDKGLIQNM
jgi:1-acyl-sn-glycerol-3-phosphate acyltransferase